MPQTSQAKKALRQSAKKAERNKIIRSTAKTLRKKAMKEIDSTSDKAQEMIKKTIKAIDKAVQKGIVKKNTAARRKSRMIKAFNKTTK
jgi:small subunit ribosomal protein S20